jgi:predicted 3-demethylubiquinone-9 3-methyltransferase (glyoxalase superfamily)
MQNKTQITPCLWFDDQAEAAAQFYTSIFRNSKIIHMSRYGEAGQEIHGKPAGTVMTVSFELDGQPFTALNGGSTFKFNEAISFQVFCDTQEEVDDYWQKLSAGGDKTGLCRKFHIRTNNPYPYHPFSLQFQRFLR